MEENASIELKMTSSSRIRNTAKPWLRKKESFDRSRACAETLS
jgi:hypothetical protein